MKKTVFLAFWLSTFGLLQAQADTTVAPTPSVKAVISLETPSTISLGEPIIVRAQINSLTPQQIRLLLGRGAVRSYPTSGEGINIATWYRVTLLDGTGKTVRSLPDPVRPITTPGHPNYEVATLQESDAVDEYWVVSNKADVETPGTYTLNVHVRLPYTLASDYDHDLAVLTAPSHEEIDEDYNIPLIVLPKDASKLRSTAVSLCKQIEWSHNDAMHIRALSEALFAMPEAEASESWVTLGTLNRGDLIGNELLTARNLACHPTSKSADILAYMAWQTPLPDNITPEEMLKQMYNIGNDPLRQHIRHLFMMHGLSSVPDKFPDSAVLD